jgi:anti-sigma-K factor RskA
MAMMSLNREAPERQDIEALLPWHAAGTLSRRDSDRVEQALASDRELARRYELVREELNETIHLNETLGAASARAMEKLFSAIDAEAPVVKKASFNLTGRLVELISSFSPRTLAYAGTAAALALVVQAAVLTTVVVRDQNTPPGHILQNAPSEGGQRAVVRFSANASLSDVTRFLDVNKAAVVQGPIRGGLYEIQLAAGPLPEADFSRAIQRMKTESRIVEFIAIKH